MTKAINGHITPESAVAMAIVAIPADGHWLYVWHIYTVSCSYCSAIC